MRNLFLVSSLTVLAACQTMGPSNVASPLSVQITRTTYGIPHIVAKDQEGLAYGAAYAHAQDNICQTANHLVTVRGERSATFGAKAMGAFGLGAETNEVIDAYIHTQLDDAKIAAGWAVVSAELQGMARGYVRGYNRYLQDYAGKMPVACNNMAWVTPMSLRDYYRLSELSVVLVGSAALGGAIIAAKPPAAKAAALAADIIDYADAGNYLRELGLLDSPYGSNAWAFGSQSTENQRGMLLGNPHFPWQGTARFYQLHLTIPGQMDVMGASIGHVGVVQIGFNKDVAWSHTVSTGKRFTLFELSLDPQDPTVYLVDGIREKMNSKTVRFAVKAADGTLGTHSHTAYFTRFGPVLSIARAGLLWTDKVAYALKDANAGNAGSTQSHLNFARAASVNDMLASLKNHPMTFVNTIAADRHGNALYADVSTVPDVDAAHLQRCAPSRAAAALLPATGMVVLNGSRQDCDWRQDRESARAGTIAFNRLPSVVRRDWLHNSNDSFYYTHPAQTWPAISPLVGDAVLRGPRTRSELIEIPELLARGKVSLKAMQEQLFENRNLIAMNVLPDLMAACVSASVSSEDIKAACTALRGFNYRNDVGATGAVLFREFWRTAQSIPKVYRLPYEQSNPVYTPSGLNFAEPAVASKIWEALTKAAKKLQEHGYALNVTLGDVQRPIFSEEPIALHGGDNIEGVLNNLGDRAMPGLSKRGIRIDYGTSYVQTVGFNAQGPVAEALLTYGQSTDPASPHRTDQLKLFSQKKWHALPFTVDEIKAQTVGPILTLTE